MDRAGVRGVAGDLKNLIFASTGPKPEIVLRDALNNAVEITRGADTCLIYDRPIPETGLTWSNLVDWYAVEVLATTNTDVAQRHLYQRLWASLASLPRSSSSAATQNDWWPTRTPLLYFPRCTCTTTPTCDGHLRNGPDQSCDNAWTFCSYFQKGAGWFSRSTAGITTPE